MLATRSPLSAKNANAVSTKVEGMSLNEKENTVSFYIFNGIYILYMYVCWMAIDFRASFVVFGVTPADQINVGLVCRYTKCEYLHLYIILHQAYDDESLPNTLYPFLRLPSMCYVFSASKPEHYSSFGF